MPPADPTHTAAAILDAAEALAQTRGYNGFSYRDLAARVGITTASIHYHFPGKADLGVALMTRYGDAVRGATADLDRRRPDAPSRLRGYAALLEAVLTTPADADAGAAPAAPAAPAPAARVCLGAMLASDFATLPGPVRDAVRTFVDENVRWLARVLAEGRAAGTLAFPGTPAAAATALFSALEGAMLVARAAGDAGRYRAAAAWVLAALAPAAA